MHRHLTREEVAHVWSIDRREVIDRMYALEDGELVLRDEHYDLQGWPPEEVEHATPVLLECFDHGGWCHGRFDDGHLVAAAILERCGPFADYVDDPNSIFMTRALEP